MTSKESRTRWSLSRTRSTKARRVVSTAAAVGRSVGLDAPASGDSVQQRDVVDAASPIIVVSDVPPPASVVDVIRTRTRRGKLRRRLTNDTFHQRGVLGNTSSSSNYVNVTIVEQLKEASSNFSMKAQCRIVSQVCTATSAVDSSRQRTRTRRLTPTAGSLVLYAPLLPLRPSGRAIGPVTGQPLTSVQFTGVRTVQTGAELAGQKANYACRQLLSDALVL